MQDDLSLYWSSILKFSDLTMEYFMLIEQLGFSVGQGPTVLEVRDFWIFYSTLSYLSSVRFEMTEILPHRTVNL